MKRKERNIAHVFQKEEEKNKEKRKENTHG